MWIGTPPQEGVYVVETPEGTYEYIEYRYAMVRYDHPMYKWAKLYRAGWGFGRELIKERAPMAEG